MSEGEVALITLFSVPKSFRGHIGMIQRNALASWRWTLPEAQILLLGDDSTIAEAAVAIGAEYLTERSANPRGTPLLNHAFDRARRVARHPVLAFVNADIVLLPNFPAAVAQLPPEPFLMVGQSRNVPIEERIAFDAPGVADRLEALWRAGSPRGPFAMDYFVFPRDLYGDLPPFVVGRARYDNWLVWCALKAGARVVDASVYVTAIHQAHDYSHVPGGLRETHYGPEARENRRLAGWSRYLHLHSILDSTHELKPEGIRRRGFPRAPLLRQLALRLTLRLSGR
jgi:hypothetical protein